MLLSNNRIKRRAPLHLERLEDRYMMDGAGFVHTNPEPDPGSVVGVAEIEAHDDCVQTWLASGQIRIDVLANDPLPEGSTSLKIKSVSQTMRGATVTISDDGTRLLYTPPSEGFGFDSFYYIVEDGEGKLGKANVTIGRKYLPTGGYYHPEFGRHDSFRFFEDSPPQTLDVLANDGLSAEAEIIEVSTPEGIGGTVSIAEDGRALIYQPPVGKLGFDSFSYTYLDTNGQTDTLQVYVQIEKPYQIRSLFDFNYYIGTGPHTLNVMDDDQQGSGYSESPRIVEISQPEYGGTLTISDDGRRVIYTPSEGFIGNIQFSYTVRYGPLDHQTAVGYEHVSVFNSFWAVDNWFAVDVDSSANELDVLANDPALGHWQLPAVTLSIASVSGGSHGGQVTISPDNKLLYTPTAGFIGAEKFTYTVRDSNGHVDSAEVTVQVAPQVSTGGLPKFTLPGELEQFLIDQAVERYKHEFGYTFQKYIGPEYPILLYGTTNDAQTVIRADGANADHSETNTQEAGVDEADIVETDGQFVYTFSNGKLVIVDVSDASNPLLVSFTAFEDHYGEMYLQGNRITLIQRGYNKDHPSVVTVLDVSDRANPIIEERTEIAAQIVDSRAVGDRVLVAVSGLQLPPLESSLTLPAPEGGSHEIRTSETLDEYVARVRATLIEQSLPTYKTYNAAGEVIASGLLTDPSQIHKPIDAIDNELMSLVTFDVGNEQAGPDSSTGIFTSNSAHVYMSGSSFYVMRGCGNETAVFKFGIDDHGKATLTATGKFDGWLLNQFSVDEHEGRLRIATTQDVMETVDQWGRPITRQQRRFNNLFVLEQNGNTLEVVGKVTNLAPTELIKSVRFLDDRAYVTTFRVVDPLFTIDLSDPTSPTVEGALKIPGFSDYLHPVGEDYVIGIGRDANEITGALGALQISLFYVGDMANPRLVDQVTMEGADWHWTEAWYDHHAVAFFPEDGVLTIPVSWYEPVVADDIATTPGEISLLSWGWWQTREQHSAIWAFEIDVDGQGGGSIEIGGSVNHGGDNQNQARRSVRVGDALITLSNDYLHVNDLHDVSEKLAEVYLGTLPRDDQFNIDAADGPVTLDVRVNDREGIAGTKPLIVGVTQPRSWLWRYWGIIDDSALVVDAISPGNWVGQLDAGTVEISEDGTSLVFTPKDDFAGTATFTYTVFDELRGEQEAMVTITVTATAQLGEVVLESSVSPTVSQPELPVNEPVATTTELIGPTGEPDAPIQDIEPMLIILPDLRSHRVEIAGRPAFSRHAVEIVFHASSQELHLPRFASFVRDDIFDTFHAARSRSVADISEDLFADLAVEFAGVE